MENKGLFIRRTVYLALFILSLVFISFRGGNLSYMLFFTIVINTILSIMYIFYVFFTIKIYQTTPERRISKKEIVPYNLKLKNEGFIAYRAVGIKFMDQLSEIQGAEELGSIDLEPGQGMDIHKELYCKYSGTYLIGVDTIEIMDYFRIFRIRFHMPEKMKVTVKPRILKLDNIAFITEEEECRSSGQKGKRNYLADNEVRRYAAGDNKRLIHWKNSAKKQELMVRNLTVEEISEYIVIMDTKGKTDDFTDKIIVCDKLRETMIALVYYIFCSGYHVISVLGSSFQKDIRSPRDFNEFYNKMIEFGFGEDGGLEELLLALSQNSREGIPFIIVSSAPEVISENVWDEIKELRSVHVIDVSLFVDMEEFLKVED